MLKKRGGANGYAALVAQRKTGKARRRKLDDYETPGEHTRTLLRKTRLHGSVLEPACGSGRMAFVMRKHGLRVTTTDIKTGHDFTKRTRKFRGHIVTNPPYRDGLLDAFVKKALELADGQVAMLVEAKYLFGEKRHAWLYGPCPPCQIIFIPERIYFHKGSGKQITSQFYNHVWLVWPDRKIRSLPYETKCVWAEPND